MATLERMHRGFDRDELVKLLFEEWNVSRQCTTGAGGHYIPVYADGPDGGFYANELGFGRHNAESDVLETTRTARQRNADNKLKLKRQHEDQQRALKQEAERLGKRPILEPWREAEGCVGCESCVPGARVEPRRIRLAGSFTSWVPFDPKRYEWWRAAREKAELEKTQPRDPRDVENAERVRRDYLDGLVVRFAHLRAAADRKNIRDRERAAVDVRAALERRRRHDGARAQMSSRRDEEKTMRRAARRALGVASTTRR